MFFIIIDTGEWKNMQRDQFKEKIIKWSNYYQNEYYIVPKTHIILIKCDIFHWIHESPILIKLICQFLVCKNMTYFEYSFTIRKSQK